MHPIAKPILIAIGGLLLLWAATILFINIYLQSEAVQTRIRDAIAREVGTPAQIRQTYYTPWTGIAISGLTLPGTDDPKRPLLEIQKIHVGVNLLSLVQGRLIVKNLDLLSPAFAFRESTKPEPTPVNEPGPMEAVLLPTDHLPQSDTGLVQTVIPITPAKSRHEMPPAQIQAFRINDGRAVFFDAKGAKTLELAGVFIEANPDGKDKFKGTYRIDRGVVWNSISPRKFEGRFEWNAGHLSLPDLQANLGDGRLSAQLEWLQDKSFVLAATIENASLQKLAGDAGMDAKGTQGFFNAKLALQGTAGQPETFAGTAEVNLAEARMEPIELIRQLGELLRVDELRLLTLKNAEAEFTIADNQVVVESLLLASENLMIDAVGTAGFAGNLDLQARLHVNEKLRKETRGLLGKNFKPSEAEGYANMPFSITGSLARPKSDLLDKMVGLKIGQDVGGLLNNL
ncbi:MAG: AsmA-like C-terminal region-containing protein, partial [Spartobacteria bacterium]